MNTIIVIFVDNYLVAWGQVFFARRQASAFTSSRPYGCISLSAIGGRERTSTPFAAFDYDLNLPILARGALAELDHDGPGADKGGKSQGDSLP